MRFARLIAFLFGMLALAQAQTDFSLENATGLVKYLCIDIGPRPMGSPAEQRALQLVVDKFREYGCDTAYIIKIDYSPRGNTSSGVAVGIKRGTTKRIILIGGHIDSVSPEIPGADDDASGSAVVMESARVLAKRQLQSTILFCCFGGEEQGLVGSEYFVDHFSNIDSISMMLQVDMANGLGIIDIDPDSRTGSAPQWLTRAAIEEFYKLGYDNLRYPTHIASINSSSAQGAGSDHESFLQRGIPALDFTTDIDKPIHTPRDNFENFDPRGMKRSGDLVLKLVERFDGGTPSREIEHYWLYLVGKTPIFIPLWSLWLLMSVSVAVAIAAFVSVRKRRLPSNDPTHIRWSGFKMTLFSTIIVLFGWFSSDVVGLIKGVRHPWFTSLPPYYLLAFFASLIGGWLSLKLSKSLRLSLCPYVFFKRTSIILIVYLALAALIGVKLTVEVSVALLFISLAALFRNPLLKVFSLVLSPLWILRLIFSEWDSFIFRMLAGSTHDDFGRWILFNGVLILFFTLYILPFLFACTAVMRDTPKLNTVIQLFRSRWTLGFACIGFVMLTSHLASTPTYNESWYRGIYVDQNYDMTEHSTDISLRSAEYLSGLRIKHGGIDTVIDSKTRFVRIQPRRSFDTTMATVTRNLETHSSGDTTDYHSTLILSCVQRPFTVSVRYSSGKDDVRAFDTRWKFRSTKYNKVIEWYSFPDSFLVIPITFQVVGKDSVREEIDVTFDKLAYPMQCERELTYFVPRTKYTASHLYKNEKIFASAAKQITHNSPPAKTLR
jgi:hypothetical protein